MSRIKEQSPGDNRIDTDSYNAMVSTVTALQNIHYDARDFVVMRDTSGFFVALRNQSANAFDFTKLAFGFQIIGRQVRIFSGIIEHGTQAISVAQTDVTLPTGTSFVFVERIWSPGFADLPALIPSPVATRPITTDFSFKKPLYQFSRASISSGPRLEKIEWMGGNIHIPGAFAV